MCTCTYDKACQLLVLVSLPLSISVINLIASLQPPIIENITTKQLMSFHVFDILFFLISNYIYTYLRAIIEK